MTTGMMAAEAGAEVSGKMVEAISHTLTTAVSLLHVAAAAGVEAEVQARGRGIVAVQFHLTHNLTLSLLAVIRLCTSGMGESSGQGRVGACFLDAGCYSTLFG